MAKVDFVCKVCKNHNLQIKHDRAQRKATIRVKQVASDYLNVSCLMTHLPVTEMEMCLFYFVLCWWWFSWKLDFNSMSTGDETTYLCVWVKEIISIGFFLTAEWDVKFPNDKILSKFLVFYFGATPDYAFLLFKCFVSYIVIYNLECDLYLYTILKFMSIYLSIDLSRIDTILYLYEST